MPDRTRTISDAEGKAQLRRREASLACKAASKPQATTQPAKEKDKDAKASD